MSTYRDELSMDYPALKDAPRMFIGCPHNWGYCDKADTPCGKIGRENVRRSDCDACWNQKMDRSKPSCIGYKDEQGINVTICVESWFIHTYTKKPMCKVRVMREDAVMSFSVKLVEEEEE